MCKWCKCARKYGLPYFSLSVSLYTIVAFIKRYCKSNNLDESLQNPISGERNQFYSTVKVNKDYTKKKSNEALCQDNL